MAVAEIKVAIVGAGWIATHGHLPGHKRAGARIVGLADPSPGLAVKVGAEFGVERTYSDWREMLAKERPDAVSVCVPNAFHREVAVAALEAGGHVLCEKPLAPTVADAEAMFAAASKAGRVLMTAQNLRFRPANQHLKAMADAGEFGRIYHAEAFYVRRLGIPTWGTFTMSRYSAGGALLDIGVHVLDCALWLMGSPRAVEVSAQVETLFGNRPEVAAARRNYWDAAAFDVDDFASAFVRLEDGATISVQASWASHIDRDREYIQILGTEAGATTDPLAIYRLLDGEKHDEALDIARIPGWEECVAHFLAVVDGTAHLQVQPEETMNLQRVLQGAYESARLARAVRLDG